MAISAYGSITVTDLLDTATYIYYSATGSGTKASDWHTTPTTNDAYIGFYSGPPIESGQPANPTNVILSSLTISKYVGEDGERGGLILNITTAPTAYTTKVGNFTPVYRIAKSTVLTQSGASDVQVGDTLAYSYYHYQVGYVDNSYVYLGAAKNLRGATGAGGVSYSLIITPNAIVKDQNGDYNFNSISLSSFSKTGSSAQAAYAGRFVIEKSTDNTNWTSVYQSSANESTYTLSAIPADIKTLRCSLYLAGGVTTLLDQQTIPILSDGIDATQYYTYVRYSANSDGSSYTETPSSSTKYIGVCVSTSTTAPAYNDSAWHWSKYIGEDGNNATQYYTYVRYSANSNGSSYVESPTTSTKYIGVCVTTATSAPAYNNSAWKWSKYVGANGNDAYTVLLTNESHTFAGGTSTALAGSTECNVNVYKGTTQISSYVGASTSATSINTGITGLTCTIANNNTTNVKLTFSAATTLTTKNGTVSIPIHADEKSFTKVFSFSVSLDGDDGVSISSITNHYLATSSGSGVTKTTSGWTTDIQTMTATNQYLWNYETVIGSDGSTLN
jgi:hypothetical protein